MAQQLDWNESAAMETPEQGSAFDVLGIVWRRKWVALCVLVLCLALGYLWFQRADRVYRSDARIMLNKKDPKVGGDSTPSKASPFGGYEEAISTQMLTVCSPRVVRLAVKAKNLAVLPAFKDVEGEGDGLVDAVTGIIISQLRVARTGDRSHPDPNIIDLFVEGPLPDDCQKILEAVIESYAAFLDETYQDFSEATLKDIKHAKDELDKQLREQEQKWMAFRLKAPYLYTTPDGRTSTVQTMRIAEIEKERSKVKIEQSQSRALADGIEAALKNGVNTKSLRFLVRNIQLDQRFSARQTYLDALLHTMLEQLANRDSYGPDHPMVTRANAQLAFLREQIGNSGADPSDTEGFLKVYLETLRQEIRVADDKIKALDADAQAESDLAKEATKDQLEEQTLAEDIRRTES